MLVTHTMEATSDLVQFGASAWRELLSQPRDVHVRILGALEALEANPHGPSTKKLVGRGL